MPDLPLNLRDLEPLAREQLDAMAYHYFAGGADDCRTLAANEAAWASVNLHPHVLTGATGHDPSTTVLGCPLPMPILTAPMAYQRLAHVEGETGMAAGAAQLGAGMVLSTFSTTDMEDVVAAAAGPVFFQLYCYRDRAMIVDLIARVESAGCKALVLTVDLQAIGNREQDHLHRFNLPADMPIRCMLADQPLDASSMEGSSLETFFEAHVKHDLSWDDVAWLRSITSLPLVLKGVLRPDDARRGVEAGASAICVSNHGGRQLDTAPATFDVLPSVVDAVGDDAEVWVDGGIRRGTDVLKAIAAGATCTLIGRPFMWALATGGAEGVAHAWRMLHDELVRNLALCGCRDLSEVGPDLIRSPC